MKHICFVFIALLSFILICEDTFAKVEFDLHGSVDFRIVATDSEKNWSEGGRGLTRYGADRNNKKHAGLKLPQIILLGEMGSTKKGKLHVQLNYSDHQEPTGALTSGTGRPEGTFGLVEGYYGKAKKSRSGWIHRVRAGFVIPNISLEHTERGWNTKYTLTPSAINAWVGEEIRATAIEYTASKKGWDLTIAPFQGNDTAGTVLSWRGWGMHDYQATHSSNLRTQSRENTSLLWTSPFKEIDGNVGYYAKIRKRTKRYELAAFYYANNAHLTSQDAEGNSTWKTAFFNLSAKWRMNKRWTMLAQYMQGSTDSGDPDTLRYTKNDFAAYYLLLSYQKKRWRYTFRYDSFEVSDLDKSNTTFTPDDSDGTATTFAISYRTSKDFTLFAELVQIDSKGTGPWAGDITTDPKDDLIQLAGRYVF